MAKKKTTTKRETIPVDAGREERERALNATLSEITKRFGDGTVVKLGEARHMAVDTISTGSLAVDIALGVGGIPRGRVTEIFGPESSGKTTLCLSVVAQAQRLGGICAFVDMEHALDPKYCETLGVDVDNLYISQPDTGEQAMEIAEELIRSGAIDVIVLDSVAALVPRAEIEGDMGDSHVGLQARLMSQALRKIAGAIKQTNTAFLLTNQLREKIGVMFGCFDEKTEVVLADGTLEEIGEIVNEKLDVEVLSYNELTQSFEPRPVVNWFNNGKAEQFFEFVVEGYQRNPHRFACTPNHLILTEDGYVEAGDLREGDQVITAVPAKIAPKEVLHAALAAGSFESLPLLEDDPEDFVPMAMPIIGIYPKARHGEMLRYDLEIEGNHCYVVDGVVVHNSPETTSGGRALRFYASVRIDIRRIQAIKQGDEVTGSRTRVKIVKNKVAPPFRQAEFDLMYGEGFSMEGDVLDIGTELGIIEKRGAFYRYNDGLIGQGRENAKQYLRENPDLTYELETLIRQEAAVAPVASGSPDDDVIVAGDDEVIPYED